MSDETNSHYIINLDHMQLTPREREVVIAILDGLDDKKIAERLSISEQTVRNKISAILEIGMLSEDRKGSKKDIILAALRGFDWESAINKLVADYQLASSEKEVIEQSIVYEKRSGEMEISQDMVHHALGRIYDKTGVIDFEELLLLLRIQYQNQHTAGQYVPAQLLGRQKEVYERRSEGEQTKEIGAKLSISGNVAQSINAIIAHKSWRWRNKPKSQDEPER